MQWKQAFAELSETSAMRWHSLVDDDKVSEKFRLRFSSQAQRPYVVAADFDGDRPSFFSLFTSFTNVIFRLRGSVLPYVALETSLAVALSAVALACTPDEEYSHLGHQFMGMLLSFLTVFRTQTAYRMRAAGGEHFDGLVHAARSFATEALGGLVVAAAANGERTLPTEGAEAVRLLKLFYFCAVEHIRSDDGPAAWDYAHHIAHAHATPHERATFVREFGRVQTDGERRFVTPASEPGGAASVWRSAAAPSTPSTLRLQALYAGESGAHALSGGDGSGGGGSGGGGGSPRPPHDPTRGKPLHVMLKLRGCAARISSLGGAHTDQHQLISSLERLGAHLIGMSSVSQSVLPLPYCQLLKILMLSWVYSLPFVLAAETRLLLPFVMALISIAFFGLEQVGRELVRARRGRPRRTPGTASTAVPSVARTAPCAGRVATARAASAPQHVCCASMLYIDAVHSTLCARGLLCTHRLRVRARPRDLHVRRSAPLESMRTTSLCSIAEWHSATILTCCSVLHRTRCYSRRAAPSSPPAYPPPTADGTVHPALFVVGQRTNYICPHHANATLVARWPVGYLWAASLYVLGPASRFRAAP